MKTERTYLESILSANVRELRERRGWRQQDLADKLGVMKYRVSEIERGVGGVTIEYLHKLANGLGVAPWELLRSVGPVQDPAVPRQNMYAVIAKNVRELRHRREYTCADLGELMGRAPTRVTEVEKERANLSISILERFAFGLAVPAWVLVHPDGPSYVE